MTTPGWDSPHRRNRAPSASRRPSSANPTGRNFSSTRRLNCCKALTCSNMAPPCFRRLAMFGSLGLRNPRQRAGMRPQRKKIRPEFIVQLARDLLAFDVLQRDHPFRQAPLVVDGVSQRLPQDGSACCRWRQVPADHPASHACHSRRIRFSSSPPTASPIGASARLTTMMVMRKRTSARSQSRPGAG